MYTIKGFSTQDKDKMLQQIQVSGADIQLPFEAEGFTVEKNPFGNFKLKSKSGKEQVITSLFKVSKIIE